MSVFPSSIMFLCSIYTLFPSIFLSFLLFRLLLPPFSDLPSFCLTFLLCSLRSFLYFFYCLSLELTLTLPAFTSISLAVTHVSRSSKVNHLQTNSFSQRQLSDISVKTAMPATQSKLRHTHTQDENDLKSQYIYVHNCKSPNQELTKHHHIWLILWTEKRLHE